MRSIWKVLALLVILGAAASCGGSPTQSDQAVPVYVTFTGAPFSVTVEGQTVSTEGTFQFNLTPGQHEISGTYSSGFFGVGFSSGPLNTGGGVQSGSLTSASGIDPGVYPCSAFWGDFVTRPESFTLRYTVTSNRLAACQ